MELDICVRFDKKVKISFYMLFMLRLCAVQSKLICLKIITKLGGIHIWILRLIFKNMCVCLQPYTVCLRVSGWGHTCAYVGVSVYVLPR
jgi:hypothetical protein